MFNRKLLCTAGAAILAGTVGSAGSAMSQTLYDELGGEDFIECWIDRSLVVISKDKKIDDFFSGEVNADQDQNLRDALVDFECAATGGPCEYAGRGMACAHAGLGIGHSDFEAFMKDLEKAARFCDANEPAYSELGKVLRSLRPAVVQDDPSEQEAALATCAS